MKSAPLRIGMVGCGTIARFHFQAIKELGEDTAAMVALCDLRSRFKTPFGLRCLSEGLGVIFRYYPFPPPAAPPQT